MLVRMLIPYAFANANFSWNHLNAHMTKLVFLGQKRYISVCASSKLQCLLFKDHGGLDMRPQLLLRNCRTLRTSGSEYNILQKYFKSVRSEEHFKVLNANCFSNSSIRSWDTSSKQFYSTSSENDPAKNKDKPEDQYAPPPPPPPVKLTLYQRFKSMCRDYWHVLIPIHLITSAGWFGIFYFAATNGVDIPACLENLNISESFIKPFRDSSLGYIAVSYGLYKIFTPARYTVTLAGTTLAIRVLKKRGLIRPRPINFKRITLWLWKKSGKP